MSLLLETPVADLTGRAGDRDFFPATVTVTRTSEADFKSRQLIVWIDGARVATLLWGDSVTTRLPPGRHSVRVSNTLVWKTLDFDLQIREQVFFEAINRTGPGTLTMLVLLGAGPHYVTLQRM